MFNNFSLQEKGTFILHGILLGDVIFVCEFLHSLLYEGLWICYTDFYRDYYFINGVLCDLGHSQRSFRWCSCSLEKRASPPWSGAHGRPFYPHEPSNCLLGNAMACTGLRAKMARNLWNADGSKLSSQIQGHFHPWYDPLLYLGLFLHNLAGPLRKILEQRNDRKRYNLSLHNEP